MFKRRAEPGANPVVWRWLAACLLVTASASAAAAESAAVITILEGEGTVLQGQQRVAAAQGLPIEPGSLIETSARATLLRLEVDHAALDLGPETRLMLSPEGFAAKGAPRPAAYLLQGWIKLSSPDDAARPGITAAGFEVVEQRGVTVAFVGPAEVTLFVESGEVRLVERRGGKALAPISLRSGESYAQEGADRGRVLARQTPTMLQRMPRVYRDTVPMRAALLKAPPPEPQPMAPPSYAELQPWLSAEPVVRRGFVRRFASRSREPDFRRGLIAHLPDHPEWRPVLFPPPPPKPPSHP